jgi:hypothetical protein
MLEGREVSVFNVLNCLEPSPFSTYEIEAEIEAVADFEALARIAAKNGAAAEDWSTSVHFLCRACSEGRPHRVHDTDAEHASRGLPCAVAALHEEHLERMLSEWRESCPHVTIVRRRLAPPPDGHTDDA